MVESKWNTNNCNSGIRLDELIYLIYFSIMFGARAIGLYEGQRLYNITLVLGALFFLIKICITNHSVLEYLLIFLLCGLSIVVYLNTGEKGILLFMTMALGLKNVSLKKVIRLATVILGTAFIILVCLTTVGVLPERVYGPMYRAGFGEVYRHSLGYPYPNTLMTTYVILVALVLLQLKNISEKRLIFLSGFIFANAIYLYIFSCSNTGIIATGMILFLNYYFYKRKTINKVERFGIVILYPLLIIGSIVIPIISMYSESCFEFFNRLTHTRMEYCVYYLRNEPITWLGTRFKEMFTSDGYAFIIDNSLFYSFMQLGLVMFVIITLANILLAVYLIRMNRRVELAIMTCLWIMGLSDPFLYNLSYKNILFLFMGEMWYTLAPMICAGRGFYKLSMRNPIGDTVGSKLVQIPEIVLGIDKFFDKCICHATHIRTRDVILFLSIIVFGLIGVGAITIRFIHGLTESATYWEQVRMLLFVDYAIGYGLMFVHVIYDERSY